MVISRLGNGIWIRRQIKTINSRKRISSFSSLSLLLSSSLSPSSLSLKVKYSNPETNLVLIRCPRDYHKLLSVALSHLTLVNNHKMLLRVFHVGATIRSCRKYAIEHDKGVFHLLKSALDDLEAQMEENEKEEEEEEELPPPSAPGTPP
mmetsp:Transcript_38284/g.53264  ORF Transcript_38284/g.53264 Transcript_38284/m.53264 type:complete len:149 (-) Transcript_38284:202-648(-)